MKKYMFTILTILFILGVVTTSHSHEDMLLKENNGLGLSVYGSIEKQQNAFRDRDIPSPKGIIPETIAYDVFQELSPAENIYDVPKAKSRIGFLCGRCNSMHYNGGHPDHDCFVCIPIKTNNCFVCIPSRECWETVIPYSGGLLLSNALACIPTVCCCCAKSLPSASNLFMICCENSGICCPNIFCMTVTGCLTSISLTGWLSYKYAESKGDQDFMDSYDRGQLCLPEDEYSSTSLTRNNVSELKVKIHKKYREGRSALEDKCREGYSALHDRCNQC